MQVFLSILFCENTDGFPYHQIILSDSVHICVNLLLI